MDRQTLLSLRAYAMVQAGLEAGASRERAFANAEVEPAVLPPEKWDDAIDEWETLLEDPRTPTKLQAEYEQALLEAQERYEPVAQPISSDVAAWVTFRRHYLAARSPAMFLREHGLGPHAFGRLESQWSDRAEGDAALAQALAEADAAPLEACPTITVQRSPLLEGDDLEPAFEPPAIVPAPPPQEAAPPVELPTYLLGDAERVAAVEAEPVRIAPQPPPISSPIAPPPVPPLALAPTAPAPAPAPVLAPALTAPPPIRSAQGISSTVGVWSELGPISAVPDTQDPPADMARATPFTPAPAPPRPPQPAEDPPVPLERYAVMYADSVVFRLNESQLVNKHGMPPAELNRAFEYWKARASSDGVLRARIDGLVERYRNALASAGRPAAGKDQRDDRPGFGPARPPGHPTPNPMAATMPAPNPSNPAPSYSSQTMPVPEVIPNSTPARPRSASSSTLAIDPQMVAEALRGALPFDEHLTKPEAHASRAVEPESIETRRVEGLSMNEYAKIVADLSVQGSDRSTVLQQHGMDEAKYRRIAEAWDKVLLEGGHSERYMRLVAQHHKLASSARR